MSGTNPIKWNSYYGSLVWDDSDGPTAPGCNVLLRFIEFILGSSLSLIFQIDALEAQLEECHISVEDPEKGWLRENVLRLGAT